MIEVLVASTILIVIVMMLAMLFQQTSLAWRTGVRRAESFMQLRSALGAIQRDASAAVDARYIPKKMRALLSDSSEHGDQAFKGSELRFYTLTGTGFSEKSDKTPLRTLSHIVYSTKGLRTETVLCADGSVEEKSSNVLKIETNKEKETATFDEFKPVNPETKTENPGLKGTTPFPLFVTIEATVQQTGKSYDIGAASAGPDKMWGTKDDIQTWVDK